MVSANMRVMKIQNIMCLILTTLLLAGPFTLAQENVVCLVYFTGVGCPHCANTDPVVLEELPKEYENLVVIEYEIYQQGDNSPLLMQYNDKYGTGLGVPLLIFDKDLSPIGDSPILDNLRENIENREEGNNCLLLDNSVSFKDLNLNKLPAFPKIWANGRILIKTGKGEEIEEIKNLMKEILFSESICKVIEENDLKETNTRPVHLSGQDIKFADAIELGTNWIIQYNLEGKEPCDNSNESINYMYLIVPITIGFLLAIVFGVKKSKKKGVKKND